MALGELEYDYQIHQKPRAGDEKLAIRFFKKAKPNPEKTQEMGRPIFEEADFISIMVPGDRTSIITRPVGDGDKVRFAVQYEHWLKHQNNDGVVGTPLEAWGVLNLAQIEEFRYFGIRTVEQMADLRDDVAAKIMGATSLKTRAKSFVEASSATAPLKMVEEKLAERDSEVEALKNAVADQAAIIARLEEKLGASAE